MIKKHIPNTITCGNLLCGCIALVQAFQGNLVWASYLVGIALVLDFFDGFTARMLKVSSAIGKDLDSLADMVTFGVVPGVLMFTMEGGGYIYFIITIFSAIRLAKFNNDTRQTNSFIGLPTPANTMIFASLPLIMKFQPDSQFALFIINFNWILPVSTFILCFLLISEIPLFALKFKNFSWESNKLVYCFLMVSVILLISLKFVAIPLIILLYILVSIVNNIFLKNKV